MGLWSQLFRGAVPQHGLNGVRPRSLHLETLESRQLLASVFLDYGDGTSGNDFQARLNELTSQLGVVPVNGAEVSQIKVALKAGLESAWSPFTVSFAETPPGGDFDTLSFGHRAGDVAGAAPNGPGYAKVDWRNLNLDGPDTAYVFPANLSLPLSGQSRAGQLTLIENALVYYGVSELGRSFGLQTADAYGDPSIEPGTYANTLGIQNRHFSSEASLGLNPSTFDGKTTFTFSPLARAKLEFAVGVTAAAAVTQGETGPAPHDTTATAQALSFQSLPIAQGRGGNVELANVAEEKDLYSFSAGEGDLVTAHILASAPYPTPPPFVFDSLLRLLGPDGVTVLATSDDIKLGLNAFGDVPGTQAVDTDSLIVNFRLPAAGTYYLEVTAKNQDPGFYDLFVAAWSPTLHPWQNVAQPRDVSNDGQIVARDVLRVINEINRAGNGGHRLPNPVVGAENPVVNNGGTPDYFYFDVNGDEYVTAIDALHIINFLNSPSGSLGAAEGESASASSGQIAGHSQEDMSAFLFAGDDWWLSMPKRR